MKKLHFIGIGGSGMSAVASIAKSYGYDVTGCETVQEYIPNLFTKRLEGEGIAVWYERDEAHLKDVDCVCISPAVMSLKVEHEEVLFAKSNMKTILTWQEFMGQYLQNDKKVLGIAGTKGKTTTTTLAGLLLELAGLDPIVEVGAVVQSWNQNYRLGKGDWFVCEADEYNRSFLNYRCDIAVITNIEMDHPEFFADYDEYLQAFVDFVANMKPGGRLIVNNDSPGCRDLLAKINLGKAELITYGRSENATIRLAEYRYNEELTRSEFNVIGLSGYDQIFESALIGEHNALNALSCVIVASLLNVSPETMNEMLLNVKPPKRRFQEVGCSREGALLVDDYAHTPSSIAATLNAAREKFAGKKLWAVWQPHMYSRTKLLMDEFCKALSLADVVVVLPIFASREVGSPLAREVSNQMVAERLNSQGVHVFAADDLAEAEIYISDATNANCVILNMGAGDNGRLIELLKG